MGYMKTLSVNRLNHWNKKLGRPKYRLRSYPSWFKPKRKTYITGKKTFNVKRTVLLSPYNLSDQRVYGALSFNLSQLPNYTEFTALFDQYRINKIKVTMYPHADNSQTPVNATNDFIPLIAFCTDTDDSTAPASVDELNQRSNVRYTKFNKPISIWIKPHVDTEIYRSAVTTGYGNIANAWIDSASSDIPHYGLKWAIMGDSETGLGANSIMKYEIVLQFYCSFRGVI